MSASRRLALVSILVLGIALVPATLFASSCPTCPQCGGGQPADTFVCGCPPPAAGQIGFGDLSGDVGDTVGVDVDVWTNSNVSTFTLDLEYPSHLLEYVSTSRGDLTAAFFLFGGDPVGADVVRITAVNPSSNPIPPGTTGTLGTIYFEVTSAGCDAFCMVNMGGHLIPYDTCAPSVTAVSEQTPGSWGSIKSAYR